MDNVHSAAANGEEYVGIPDDVRCKRSDGKQWRCTAMCMPDKTVCEKHYIQAKKRAASSALRASLKKAKRTSLGENEVYLEGKSDDQDMPLVDIDVREEYPSGSTRMSKERAPRNQVPYSPESPPLTSMSIRNSLMLDDDMQRDIPLEEKRMSYRTPPPYVMESFRNISQMSLDANVVATSEDHSDGSTNSSGEAGGLTCHQCRRSDKSSVIWCLKCDRRGYCTGCISSWYSDIALEEIERVCPACRGACSCKVCSRTDNLIKARIREIPVQYKLQYLYCLLSSVLPVVKHIHQEQCAEVELEKKLRGAEVDLERTKLNSDEQMCCDCCRVPIVDYHRHCSNCSYDLCLSCCQDLRAASLVGEEEESVENPPSLKHQVGETVRKEQSSSKNRLQLHMKYPGWRANSDDSIPCLPQEHGGCGSRYLTLQRIFKMNWVAKLVKNLEEMVTGCKVNDTDSNAGAESLDPRFCQCANRENSNDNFLYSPSAQEIKSEGIDRFRKYWVKGQPVIVKQVCNASLISSWDPMVIWKEICETTDEPIKDAGRTVKAIDCLNWLEVDIELGQFMKGYSEGRIRESGWPEMLKLKDWPSPSASEEFLLYQRPEFISRLPLLEFIHSKWGILNVAAKLPHYSLQNDVGPKIFISYGMDEELGSGDSVTSLHFNMRDMVYMLVHSCEVKLKGSQQTKTEKIRGAYEESEAQEFSRDPQRGSNEANSPMLPLSGHGRQNEREANLDINLDEKIQDRQSETIFSIQETGIDPEYVNEKEGDTSSDSCPGVLWDVFRREDVPKLVEYLSAHWEEFGKGHTVNSDTVTCVLYDEAVYLNRHHKIKLKEEFGVEPWSFEQYFGQAVFIPAGCPFQVRNLQSTVQLGLDFLSPESLLEAVKMAEDVRCLPNDHAAKLQMVEVGKISLYAASSAIKEVQKLVLDPKFGTELGFEDHNLTGMVSENLENMMKQRQIACA